MSSGGESVRDRAVVRLERRLEEVGKVVGGLEARLVVARGERVVVVREAVGAGLSLRRVGVLLGLSHVQVRRLLESDDSVEGGGG